MTVNPVFHKLYLLCLLLIFASVAWGQSDTGTPSYEPTIAVNAFESVNLSNLNILLQAPVRSKGGPIPLHFMLTDNFLLYIPSGSSGIATTGAMGPTTGGPILARGYWSGNIGYMTQQIICSGGGNSTQYNFKSLIDQNGTSHPITPVGWDGICGNTGAVDVYTTDNTGYEMVIPAGDGVHSDPTITIYDKTGRYVTSGIQQHGNGTTITDTHGNQVVTSSTGLNGTYSYTDELSSTAVLSHPTTPVTGATVNYTYTDATGTQRSVSAAYLGGASGKPYLPIFPCGFNLQSTIYPLQSVSYPNGSSLNLTWETTPAGNLDGRLATLQVPTGGIYTHIYSGGTHGDGLWCETAAKISNATLAISDGTGTWTFTRSNPANGTTWTTTVTKPDGSKAVYSFNTGIVVSIVIYDTNGTTELDRMTYCYDSTIASCNPAAPTQHPTWVRAYHTVPGVTGNAEVDTKFDTYGNVVEVDRFDYGPTLINKQVISYGDWNGSTCASLASIHIIGAPCEVLGEDASSAVLSRTRFDYDASTGDLLHSYAYSGASTFLTTAMTYNTNGTVATTTGPDGVAITTGNSQCNGLLPDHTTSAVGTTSMTWDCNGAVPLTSTDLNGLTVTTTYGDPLYRVTQVSDNGGQAPVSFDYPSTTQSDSWMTFNSGNSQAETTTKRNTLGQVISVQHRQAPTSTNYDTVSFAYDSTGHKTSVSTACTTTLGATCPTHAVEFTYDGLARLKTKTVKTATNGVLTFTYPNGDVKTVLTPTPTGENSKIVQVERDGLGRTKRVCSVITSGLSGGGSCGQRATGSGYLTLYTLDPLGRATQVSRNAQAGATPVNSTATYDMLSRVTQVVTPESGTTIYQYDSQNADCSTGVLAGHLNRSVDFGTGNERCYAYDSMGRLSLLYHNSGAYANTPAKYYFYDGAGGGAHGLGRLGDGQTKFTPFTSIATEQKLGYDLYGRVSDVWESTPATSGSFFHVTASYWDNGALKTLTGIPGVSNYSYGLDSEGRPYSATSGATGIVASVSYDSASNPLTITYTSGDKDVYQWDAFSQNTTQYQFTVGASNTTDTGVLTWNPNGTLKQLQITDNLTSTDTQTCLPGHDDLVRISGWNCGALANGTYSYSPDYAGNVTKGGTFLFSPGYHANNNQMLAPYTYDGTGNMLHDGTLAQDYTWDTMGSLVSYAAHPVINDAFGNMVQKTVGSTNTFYVATPIGAIGSTSSLTAPLSLRIPLPGGSSITYDGSGNQQINHKDFVGSTRLVTNRAARTLVGVFCYGPMGEIYCGTASSSQYEGQAQDTTTGLFDYGSTRYSGTQGRSISPAGGANGYVKTNSPF